MTDGGFRFRRGSELAKRVVSNHSEDGFLSLVRDSGPKMKIEEAQAVEEIPEVSMTVQVWGGKVVEGENGPVVRIGAYSLVLQGGLAGNADGMVSAMGAMNPLLARLAGNSVDYNVPVENATQQRGKLLAGFAASDRVEPGLMSIFGDTLEASELFVNSNRGLMSEKGITTFENEHAGRREQLAALQRHIGKIFSSYEHSGSNASGGEFGISWIQDMRFDGEKLMTIGPGPGFLMSEVTPELIAEQFNFGHREQIIAWLKFLQIMFRKGSKNFFGFQIDSTASIDGCGAKAYQMLTSSYDTTGNGQWSMVVSGFAAPGEAAGEGGSGGNTEGLNLCASCGKSTTANQNGCSCAMHKQKQAGVQQLAHAA